MYIAQFNTLLYDPGRGRMFFFPINTTNIRILWILFVNQDWRRENLTSKKYLDLMIIRCSLYDFKKKLSKLRNIII